MKRKIGIMLILALLVCFAACTNPANGGGGNVPIPVTGVSVSQETLSLARDATSQLSATVLPANATNRGVTWSSSDTEIATVSSTGVVTGVTIGGPVTITVTTQDGGFTATSTVTVVEPVALTNLEISPDTFSVTLGANTVTRTVTITPTPANASNAVEWASTNSAVATASGNTITFHGTGQAALIATSTVTSSIQATVTVTVTGPGGNQDPGPGENVPIPVEYIHFGSWAGLTAIASTPGATTGGIIAHPSSLASGSSTLGTQGNPIILNAATFGTDAPTARVGNVPPFSREVQVLISPANASIPQLTWTSLTPVFATIGTGSGNTNTITVNNTAGQALFRVSSRTNPIVHLYFALDVLPRVNVGSNISTPVRAGGIPSIAGTTPLIPNWAPIAGGIGATNDGLNFGTPMILGTPTAYNRGRLSVTVHGVGGNSPSNPTIRFHIEDRDGRSITDTLTPSIVNINHGTGEVIFQVLANRGTGDRTDQVVRIRAYSEENTLARSPWVYIRVLQPVTSVNFQFGATTIAAAGTRDVTVIPTPAHADIMKFQWDTTSPAIHWDHSFPEETTDNPFTLTAGNDTGGSATLNIRVRARDFFTASTEWTTPWFGISNILVTP